MSHTEQREIILAMCRQISILKDLYDVPPPNNLRAKPYHDAIYATLDVADTKLAEVAGFIGHLSKLT